jgi:hypothetical protein
VPLPPGNPLFVTFNEQKPKKGTWVYWVVVQYAPSVPGQGFALSDFSNPKGVVVP